MLCGCRLVILHVIFEFVFYKWSLLGRWSRRQGLGAWPVCILSSHHSPPPWDRLLAAYSSASWGLSVGRVQVHHTHPMASEGRAEWQLPPPQLALHGTFSGWPGRGKGPAHLWSRFLALFGREVASPCREQARGKERCLVWLLHLWPGHELVQWLVGRGGEPSSQQPCVYAHTNLQGRSPRWLWEFVLTPGYPLL